jgi:hypothetical protein
MIFRPPTATLLLGIALSAASLPASAQNAVGDAEKPAPQKAHKTLHAPKKHVARHDFVKPQVTRTPPAQAAPISPQGTPALVPDHPPNEFRFGDVDATVHGYLGMAVGGTAR